MKDQENAEVAATRNARITGERVWITPALSRSMAPLLSGLGIELLAPGERERATIRVEPIAADMRAAVSAGRLRIERVGDRAHGAGDAIEFEASGPWAAASYVVSRAFGVSPPLLTADAAMFAVVRAAARAGQVDSPILVTGETGTGKELLVRLIHAASGRAGGMFSVNCAALNDAVLTASSDDAMARAEDDENRLDDLCAAADTTLFLDQVSELSAASQTRVLHALLRAGDSDAGQARIGARLVSATNRPLEPMVLNGELRRELYDRIAVLTLAVPPLRERHADIAMLAAGFLSIAAPQLHFTPDALKALSNYPSTGRPSQSHINTRVFRSRRAASIRKIYARIRDRSDHASGVGLHGRRSYPQRPALGQQGGWPTP